MAHFLFQGRYTARSVKAMVANPEDREAAARQLIESLGAKMHAFYFTFGDYDFMAIVEGDKIAMAGGSMTVAAAGAVSDAKTTPLLTSSEAMEAMAKAKAAAATYSPPG
ncbi:MAG: GYD domain-containing protein [Paracoccaceae bacterium]